MTVPIESIKPGTVWRLFDVFVSGYGAEIITAPSRGKALANSWRSPAFDGMPFSNFLRIARATVRRDTPIPDGYDYIRRVYDLSPTVGQRCRCGKKDGTVLYPGTSTAHVRIILDGDDWPVSAPERVGGIE